MPASKAKVIEQLSQVKNLGEAYATHAYEDLGVRSLDDLIEAAKANKLQDIKGIGAAKEKKILASAEELKGESAPAPAPEKKSTKSSKGKSSKGKSSKGKSTKDKPAKGKASKGKSTKADEKAKAPAPEAKEAKKEAKKEEKKEEAPKAAKSEEKPKSASRPSQRERTTYRPPQPKGRPSIPGLLFKLGKKIIGRILG